MNSKSRVVTPDHWSFREAGRMLAAIGREGMGITHRRLIVNDVLIAVTALKSGAVLITANANDFSLIEKHTPLRWMLPG